MKTEISIMWFRRDLRLEDNHALSKALESGKKVLPIFIFDVDLLNNLKKDDHRVTYIHSELAKMNTVLKDKFESSLAVFYGKPLDVFSKLINQYRLDKVYLNQDYEPQAIQRDDAVKTYLKLQGIPLCSYKDQVIFEKGEVVKDCGNPYIVYTPYMKRWKMTFNRNMPIHEFDCDTPNYLQHQEPFLSLEDIGFTSSKMAMPIINIQQDLINSYGLWRDYPSKPNTSRIGTALRFGTVSIRALMQKAIKSDDKTFMNELIWREFFMQVLWHFPHTNHKCFREKYEQIPWRNDSSEFQKWKDGQTGYPIVDAGMRELNETGYMHNRVRMITASFLCKHLLIDWRKGERYFAEKLFDYELSSNVGNWQWAAGSGVDAAPYFRVFNPELQMKKFDAQGEYIRKWVPEYFGYGYPTPMVDHKTARIRAIETYKMALR
ncbi:MAG: cryptochrome/photolyase family protein [Flavobacteriales bacterium]